MRRDSRHLKQWHSCGSIKVRFEIFLESRFYQRIEYCDHSLQLADIYFYSAGFFCQLRCPWTTLFSCSQPAVELSSVIAPRTLKAPLSYPLRIFRCTAPRFHQWHQSWPQGHTSSTLHRLSLCLYYIFYYR